MSVPAKVTDRYGISPDALARQRYGSMKCAGCGGAIAVVARNLDLAFSADDLEARRDVDEGLHHGRIEVRRSAFDDELHRIVM